MTLKIDNKTFSHLVNKDRIYGTQKSKSLVANTERDPYVLAREAWKNADKLYPHLQFEPTALINKAHSYGRWCNPFFLYDNTKVMFVPIDAEFNKKSTPTFRHHNPHLTCRPSFETISNLNDAHLSSIYNFEISHKRFGKVIFKEPIDIRELVLDEIFVFNDNEVEVNSENTKLSGKLVEIHVRTFPYSITPQAFVEYAKELMYHSKSIGARFIAYERGTY